MRRLGKEIRKFRVEHELSGRKFAAQLGCSPAFFSAVETGVKPMPYTWLEFLPDHFEDLWVQDMTERSIEHAKRKAQSLRQAR